MHVGLYAPGWPMNDYPNGIVAYVHHLRRGLLHRGHRVSVFAGHVSPGNEDAGIYPIRATPLQVLYARSLGRFRKQMSHTFFRWRAIASTINTLHRKDPLDVIEMEESFGWCAAVQRSVHLPLVVKLHGPAFLTLSEDERRTAFGQKRVQLEGTALQRLP